MSPSATFRLSPISDERMAIACQRFFFVSEDATTCCQIAESQGLKTSDWV